MFPQVNSLREPDVRQTWVSDLPPHRHAHDTTGHDDVDRSQRVARLEGVDLLGQALQCRGSVGDEVEAPAR